MNLRQVWVFTMALLMVAFTLETGSAQDPDENRQDDQRQLEEPGRRMGRGRRRGQGRQGRRGQRGPEQNSLKVGQLAPDFTLSSLDGESETTLSQFRGEKPVVLFFGSYT